MNLYLNISIIFVLVSNKIPRTIQSSSNNPEFPAFYYLQNNNNLNISQTVPPTVSVKTRSGQDLIIKIRLSFSPLFCRRSSLINRRVNLRTNSRTETGWKLAILNSGCWIPGKYQLQTICKQWIKLNSILSAFLLSILSLLAWPGLDCAQCEIVNCYRNLSECIFLRLLLLT